MYSLTSLNPKQVPDTMNPKFYHMPTKLNTMTNTMNPKSHHLQSTLKCFYQAETQKTRLSRMNCESRPLQSTLRIP